MERIIMISYLWTDGNNKDFQSFYQKTEEYYSIMIFLIRHGEDDNTRLGGWSDAGLSALGIEQAKRASERIANGNNDIRMVKAPSSSITELENLGMSLRIRPILWTKTFF